MTETFSLAIIGFLSGLVVLMVVTTTAFIKLSIVFFIIRNALGLQQVPSNLILQTFATVLAIYISMPVFHSIYEVFKEAGEPTSIEAWVDVMQKASAPVQEFISRNTGEEHKEYFQSVTAKIWKDSAFTTTKEDLVILVPAFIITEMSRAFEIGFLLYLPFVAIDLVLTIILMAMGMMMVPPTILSVPFKLLLFIMIGGWTKLIQGLVLTYSV
ncbi:MAG: type III secretion system export apparatus subunit SctR [Pseudomonadota bacterium]